MDKKTQDQIIQMSEIAIKTRQKAVKKKGLTIESYQVFMVDQLNLFLLKKIIKKYGHPKKETFKGDAVFHFAHLLKDVSELDPRFVKDCLEKSYIPEEYREQIVSLMKFHEDNERQVGSDA